MAKQKKGKFFKRVRFFFVTLLLIGIMCASICGVALAYYLRVYVEPEAAIDLKTLSLGMDLTSIVYAWDNTVNDYVEYETLHGQENRIWADLDDIPQDLQNAFIAIEDKRFYQHKGVDWKRTSYAILNWITGKEGGGSTITQQLIKNLTDYDDYSVKRKLTEIFRALELEKEVQDKDKILEMYLNTIYLGRGSYGVNTAAMTYFGKELADLNLAECAILAGITKNPSRFDPFNHPENIKERQETILDEMLSQKMITESEKAQAKVTTLDYKSEEAKAAINEPFTYFTDTVISDVINDLNSIKGYSYEYASWKVMSGGVKIYTTVDLNVQRAMEEVYEDDSNFPQVTQNGSRPESAMIICDKKGNVLGIVGGRGKKSESRSLNRATQSIRQPGSSIKPLSVYGPAMDADLITPYSVLTDMPFKVISGKAWPRNDNNRYSGQMVIKTAVAKSINAVAVRVVDMLTPQASFDFLYDKLYFRNINQDKDADYSPMALGGMNGGVTVREMAAGYTIFLNDGIFDGSRTYSKVVDSDGSVLLENLPLGTQAFENEKTAYYMREVLQGVTASGTATGAKVTGMETAGKTGTTQKKRDLWFCGFTPYYVGATWFGYDKDYNLNGVSGNPSTKIWTKIMNKIHEGLESKKFDDGDDSNFVRASYCEDSGLSPIDACSSDVSGSRVSTGRFWKGDQPSVSCNLHKFVEICSVSHMRASKYCPSSSVKSSSLLDLTRKFPLGISLSDQGRCFNGENDPIGTGSVVSGGDSAYNGVCTIHDGSAPSDNVDPENPDGTTTDNPPNGDDNKGNAGGNEGTADTPPDNGGHTTPPPVPTPDPPAIDPSDPEIGE